MSLLLYVAKIAVDKDTGQALPELQGQGGTIIARGNPSVIPTIYEGKDGSLVIPGSAITVNRDGFTSSFWVDDSDLPISWWDGSVEVPLESVEGIAIRLDDLEVLFADTAAAAEASAQAAIDAAQAAIDAANLADAPADEAVAAMVESPATLTHAAVSALVDPVAAQAVNLTGDQVIAGVKTFASPPVVPDGSFTQAKVTGLVPTLADLSDRIVAPVDRIAELKTSSRGIMVGHRGGARIYPEHTMPGYRDCFDSGFLIETDVRKLSTGELVCTHDATTGRTMTGSDVAVDTLSLQQWLSRQVISPWYGGDGAAPVLWEEVLDHFGGKTVIVAEVKAPGVLTDLIDSVTRRGLHRSVIIQSFTLSDAQAAAAAGIGAMFLSGATTDVTPTQLVSAGIEFFGPSQAMSSATMTTFRSEGIKVVPYTVRNRGEWVSLQAKGVDGAFFDDPWGATQRYAQGHRDPFRTNVPFKGWEVWRSDVGVTNSTYTQASYRDAAGLTLADDPETAGSMAIRQGWARPATVTSGQVLRCRFLLGFNGKYGATTRWGGVFIGQTPNEQAYNDDGSAGVVGQSGYHFLIRRNGTLDVFKVTSGNPAVDIGSLSTTPALNANGRYSEVQIEILLTSTNVQLRRMDTGGTLTASDTAFRSNLSLHFSANGTPVLFKDVFYGTVPAGEV